MTPDTYPDLFWSYTVVWAILAVYIGILGYRVSALERALSRRERSQGDNESAAVCNSQR